MGFGRRHRLHQRQAWNMPSRSRGSIASASRPPTDRVRPSPGGMSTRSRTASRSEPKDRRRSGTGSIRIRRLSSRMTPNSSSLGSRACKASVGPPYSGGRTELRYTLPASAAIDPAKKTHLTLWLRARNPNVPGWQDGNPLVTLYGPRRRGLSHQTEERTGDFAGGQRGPRGLAPSCDSAARRRRLVHGG